LRANALRRFPQYLGDSHIKSGLATDPADDHALDGIVVDYEQSGLSGHRVHCIIRHEF
jgi:hypothetical protein